jgi:hypothetical protein
MATWRTRVGVAAVFVGLTLGFEGLGIAEEPPAPPPGQEPAVAPAKPSPYSLPWQLRGVIPAHAVRNDVTLGFYKDPTTSHAGFEAVESFFASVKVAESVALGARLTGAGNSAPKPGPPPAMPMPNAPKPPVSGNTFANPAINVLFSAKVGDFRIAPVLSMVMPLGLGGGDAPVSPGADAANKAGVRVRSAMDNALWNPNYLSFAPGLGVAFIRSGFTAQIEVTPIEAFRVRGNAKASPDAIISNLTMGLHLGYFIIPQLSLGAEIRYQRFISTPASVKKDELPICAMGMMSPKCNPPTYKSQGLRDTATFAIGPRGNFKLGEHVWIKPGLAYARGIDDPLSMAGYNMLQIDVPVTF